MEEERVALVKAEQEATKVVMAKLQDMWSAKDRERKDAEHGGGGGPFDKNSGEFRALREEFSGVIKQLQDASNASMTTQGMGGSGGDMAGGVRSKIEADFKEMQWGYRAIMKELKQAYNEQLELKSDENAALLDQLNEMARR